MASSPTVSSADAGRNDCWFPPFGEPACARVKSVQPLPKPQTNSAEIESLIDHIRKTNIEPEAKSKIEQLLGTVLPLADPLQQKPCRSTVKG